MNGPPQAKLNSFQNMADQFISVREAAQLLRVSEKKIMDLVEGKRLGAYRIAGQFLRLKRNEVLNLQIVDKIVEETVQFKYTSAERLWDFVYYNDFYIIAMGLIGLLLYLILYLK